MVKKKTLSESFHPFFEPSVCSFWLFWYVRESAACYYFHRHLWSFGHRPLYTFQRSSKKKGIRGEFTTIQGERSFLLASVQQNCKFYITAITLKSTRRLFCGKRLRRKEFLVVISSSTYPSSSLGWGKRFRP